MSAEQQDLATATTLITQLVLRERQSRDRAWWSQMAECFHEDSTVLVSWMNGSGAEFVAGSKAMTERGIRGVHRLAPPVVYVNGDRGVVEVPGVIEVRGDLGGVQGDHLASVRFLYRVQRDDGETWLIRALTCIYEQDSMTPAVPGTEITVDEEKFLSFRESYRCISYALSLRGATVPDDLYGDDQPERVAELYSDAFAWMGGKHPLSED